MKNYMNTTEREQRLLLQGHALRIKYYYENWLQFTFAPRNLHLSDKNPGKAQDFHGARKSCIILCNPVIQSGMISNQLDE